MPMLDKEKSYSVLFIGNSYTYYNDMPSALFAPMARSAGYDLTVTAITKGAHTLEKMASPADEYGALVAEALSGKTAYDFVVLQEQSLRPAKEDRVPFFSAVEALAEKIRATGAEPMLYATWGRKADSDALKANGWTNESMTMRLAAGYDAIARKLGIRAVHVGLAFRDVYTHAPAIELYNPDLSHPSYEGSFLAAATLLCGIFGIPASEITYHGDLEEAHAALLLAVADTYARLSPTLPQEYRLP